MARIASAPEPTVGPVLQHRDLSIASVTGYRHLGCYSDNTDRILTATKDEAVVRNDAKYCCEWCRFLDPGWKFCGLENGNNCYCDSTTAYDIATEPATNCNSQCAGEGSAACGGFFYMDLYTMTASPASVTATGSPTQAKVPGYSNLGCFTDHDDRVLADAQITPAVLNPQFCCDWCAHQGGGYELCGVEFGNQCYCGRSTTDGAQRATAADCSQACSGHEHAQCGGLYRMNIYSATGVVATSVAGGSTSRLHTATTTSTNPSGSNGGSSSDDKSSGLSGGAIAGIVIGVIAAIALLAAILLRRRLASLFQKGHHGASQLDDTQVGADNKHPQYKSEPGSGFGGYEMIHASEMDGSAPQRPAELSG